MAKDPAFLFYSSDFLTGVIDMTMEERGQYITLMCLQHQKGRLSERTIRFCVGSVSDTVMSKFRRDENGLYFNDRLESEIEQRAAFTKSRRENGRKGGRPKGEKPLGFADDNQNETYIKPTQNLMEDENENEDEIENRGDIESENTSSRARKKIKHFKPDDKAYKAALYLDNHICKRFPSQKPSDEHRLQSWADAFDKCHRIDGQSWDDISSVLRFSQNDSFWQSNILSGSKFREKYLQLLAKMQAGGNSRSASSPSTTAMSDLQKLHEMFKEEENA